MRTFHRWAWDQGAGLSNNPAPANEIERLINEDLIDPFSPDPDPDEIYYEDGSKYSPSRAEYRWLVSPAARRAIKYARMLNAVLTAIDAKAGYTPLMAVTMPEGSSTLLMMMKYAPELEVIYMNQRCATAHGLIQS